MPRQITAPSNYPQAVLRQIEQLAQNITIARKRRGESQAQWAKKLGVSQPTMARIERGDPSVAMASYVMCIWLINPAAGLAALISPVNDHAALERELAKMRDKRKPPHKVKKPLDAASPAAAKKPTDSNPSRRSSAVAAAAANGPPGRSLQQSLEAAIRAVSGLPPELSVEAGQRKVLEDFQRVASVLPGMGAGDHALKMREDFQRALLEAKNPTHLPSQAQGIAALFAKTGPKKNG